MKLVNTTLVSLAVLAFAGAASAATIGESPVEGGGNPDGWSGVTYLSGYGSLPVGETVTSWEFYADETRADGFHNVQPLVLVFDDPFVDVWAVGPVSNPEEGGAYSEDWVTDPIPDDEREFYAGVWQWNESVDNEAGGLIPFNADGGGGMEQIDMDGTSYEPAPGDELPTPPGHASAAGGRAYQFNFTTSGGGGDECDPNTLGDLDGNGKVEFADFLVLSGNFGVTFDPADHTKGDIDCDTEVAFADFLVLSANFGTEPAGSAAVPEPSAFALFGVVCLSVGHLRRRRR